MPFCFDPVAGAQHRADEQVREAVAAHRVQAPAASPVRAAARPGFEAWARTNASPQRDPAFVAVTVTLPLGDITSAQLRVLADLALAYGDGTVRTTHDQNLLLR